MSIRKFHKRSEVFSRRSNKGCRPLPYESATAPSCTFSAYRRCASAFCSLITARHSLTMRNNKPTANSSVIESTTIDFSSFHMQIPHHFQSPSLDSLNLPPEPLLHSSAGGAAWGGPARYAQGCLRNVGTWSPAGPLVVIRRMSRIGAAI